MKHCFAATHNSSGTKPCKDKGIASCFAEIRNNTACHLQKYSNMTTWHTSILFLWYSKLLQKQNSLRNAKNKAGHINSSFGRFSLYLRSGVTEASVYPRAANWLCTITVWGSGPSAHCQEKVMTIPPDSMSATCLFWHNQWNTGLAGEAVGVGGRWLFSIHLHLLTCSTTFCLLPCCPGVLGSATYMCCAALLLALPRLLRSCSRYFWLYDCRIRVWLQMYVSQVKVTWKEELILTSPLGSVELSPLQRYWNCGIICWFFSLVPSGFFFLTFTLLLHPLVALIASSFAVIPGAIREWKGKKGCCLC